MSTRKWRARIVIAVLMLSALCTSAACAVAVIIKPNPSSKAASDVYLKDSRTGKTTKFITLRDVYANHYHAAEYRGGRLYITIRSGGEEAYRDDPTSTDELWRYAPDGKGTKLWSGRGLDFRVSDDASRTALIAAADGSVRSLFLLDRSGKTLRQFIPKGLIKADFDFEGWAGDKLWLKDAEAMDVHGLVRIDGSSMRTRYFDLSELSLNHGGLGTQYLFPPHRVQRLPPDVRHRFRGRLPKGQDSGEALRIRSVKREAQVHGEEHSQAIRSQVGQPIDSRI